MGIGKSNANVKMKEDILKENTSRAVTRYNSEEVKVKPIEFGTSDDELAPYQVHRTHNYSKFNPMGGNRQVLNDRVKKILESYDKIGCLPTPIIVNENYEILDGQGRFKANKERNLPIDYIIVKKGSIEDCREINQANTPWGEEDYIESHALTGNINYIRAKELHKEYKYTYLGIFDFAYNYLHCGGVKKQTYCNGTFRISDETFEFLKENAETITSFGKFIEILGARREQVEACIFWLMYHKGIDVNHLKNNISKLEILPVTNSRGKVSYSYPRAVSNHAIQNVESLFTFIVEVYNDGLSKNKQLNIETLLEEQKNSVIKSKYGERKKVSL